MPNEPQEPIQEPTGAEPQEPVQDTPTVEELLAERDELKKTLEQRTNELKGTDSTLGKLRNEFDEFRKSKETEDETKAREIKEAQERAEQEKQNFYTEKSTFETERNKWQVEKKAFDLGFTAEDIEALKFTSIEHVESTRAYLDAKVQATKEDTLNNIEKSRTGNREILTGQTEASRFPNAIEKAFK